MIRTGNANGKEHGTASREGTQYAKGETQSRL